MLARANNNDGDMRQQMKENRQQQGQHDTLAGLTAHLGQPFAALHEYGVCKGTEDATRGLGYLLQLEITQPQMR